ncbi:MAG: THUMP domain-containing protein [Syntrophobacterales bacterium]|jgi:putative N6-adenine-specific DNA methylase|nr:THUMP domain-containing protein [Syntrophobacterales bacterium]
MKNYLYQTQGIYFAQCADDIKDVARQELISLGAKDTRITYRGIHFRGDKAALYRINYHGRFITRVLAPLVTFDCPTERHLYKQAFQITWDDFLTTAGTFAVYAALVRSQLNHSQFAALRLKDAIADSFRTRQGSRPSVDARNPDVWFNLYIEDNKATISVDTSGGTLHRRGYRPESVSAPMMETLAAAIIQYSAWNGETPLYDPFCGSGTILCEAYIHASRMPAGMLRRGFGLEKLPDFDFSLWKEIVREGKKGMVPVRPGMITGSDISAEAVEMARRNARILDPGHRIRIEQRDIFQVDSLSGKTIICNPPYGIRMGNEAEMDAFYQNLGDFFKKRCTNSTAYVYFGERAYIKKIGLKTAWKKVISNGGLDGRLVRYDLY